MDVEDRIEQKRLGLLVVEDRVLVLVEHMEANVHPRKQAIPVAIDY